MDPNNLNQRTLTKSNSEGVDFSGVKVLQALMQSLEELEKTPKYYPGANKLFLLTVQNLRASLFSEWFPDVLLRFWGGQPISAEEIDLWNETIPSFLKTKRLRGEKWQDTKEQVRKTLLTPAERTDDLGICVQCGKMQSPPPRYRDRFCSQDCFKARLNHLGYIRVTYKGEYRQQSRRKSLAYYGKRHGARGFNP